MEAQGHLRELITITFLKIPIGSIKSKEAGQKRNATAILITAGNPLDDPIPDGLNKFKTGLSKSLGIEFIEGSFETKTDYYFIHSYNGSKKQKIHTLSVFAYDPNGNEVFAAFVNG